VMIMVVMAEINTDKTLVEETIVVVEVEEIIVLAEVGEITAEVEVEETTETTIEISKRDFNNHFIFNLKIAVLPA